MWYSSGVGDAADKAMSGRGVMTPMGYPLYGLSKFPKNPRVTEHLTFTGAGTSVSLRHTNVSNVVVIDKTITGGALATPTAAYVITTDYTVNTTTGVVTQTSGGGIGTTEEVKITYTAPSMILLTPPRNLLAAICEELSLLVDLEIYKYVDMFAMHARVGATLHQPRVAAIGFNIARRTIS